MTLPGCAYSTRHRRATGAAHVLGARYRDEYITQLMVRDRFMQLHRYFHIKPPVDRGVLQTVVEKTSMFYHQCQRLFQQYYVPGQDFTVDDDPMIRPLSGRSIWITIIKAKPTPMGFKLYTIASEGYLLGFRIFRGKGGYDSKKNVLHHVVIDLVQPWGDANRRLYFDNLYTSPALCDHLLQLGIRSCGTCRSNRAGLPDDLVETMGRLDKDQTSVWQRGQLGCLVWHAAKLRSWLSTHQRVDKLTDNPAAHGRPATRRPTVAVDYNLNKGHVDQVDQLRAYYVVQRRTRRTWPALAWWLLDMSISNVCKLWCLETNTKHGLLHFRERLLQQIAATYPCQRTHVQPGVPASTQGSSWPLWHAHSPAVQSVHCTMGRAGGRRSEIVCDVCRVH